MKADSIGLKVLHLGFVLGLSGLACGFMLPAAAQDRSEKLRSYQADRRACLSGESGQALDACMKEARAVFAQQPGATALVTTEIMPSPIQIPASAGATK